jgi:type I restriction enzyme, R subunit
MLPDDYTTESLSEADTLSKLMNPSIHRRGWTEAHIRREVTALSSRLHFYGQ